MASSSVSDPANAMVPTHLAVSVVAKTLPRGPTQEAHCLAQPCHQERDWDRRQVVTLLIHQNSAARLLTKVS
jgi:hypothetical protein